MVVGGLAFTSLIPQVSLQASSQGKEVGEQASTRRARPVRGPILRRIIPLSWLVASRFVHSRMRGMEILGCWDRKGRNSLITEDGKRIGSGMHSTS
jgi:hypothetical protein